MDEPRYSILFNDEIVVTQVKLSDATLLIEALAEKYYANMESVTVISICRMEEEDKKVEKEKQNDRYFKL